MATRLLGAGYRLIVCDRNEEAVNRLQAGLQTPAPLPGLARLTRPANTTLRHTAMSCALRGGLQAPVGGVRGRPTMHPQAPARPSAGRGSQGGAHPRGAGLHPRPLRHHLHAAVFGARSAGGPCRLWQNSGRLCSGTLAACGAICTAPKIPAGQDLPAHQPACLVPSLSTSWLRSIHAHHPRPLPRPTWGLRASCLWSRRSCTPTCWWTAPP